MKKLATKPKSMTYKPSEKQKAVWAKWKAKQSQKAE